MDKKFFFNNLGEAFDRLKLKLNETDQMIKEDTIKARETGDVRDVTMVYAGAWGKISAAIESHIITFNAMRDTYLPDSPNDLSEINVFTSTASQANGDFS